MQSSASVDAAASPGPRADCTGPRPVYRPPARRVFSPKVAHAGLWLAVLLAVPYAHPRLARFRVLQPKERTAELADVQAVQPTLAVGEASLPGPTEDNQNVGDQREHAPVDPRSPIARSPAPEAAPAAAAEEKPPRSIEDPGGKALDAFFAKLLRVERNEPGAIARIAYYGDSIVGSDLVTGKLRRMLQTRFGDAGHGYALLANAWPGWFHIDVSRTASADWKVSRVIGPFAADGLYGLGGVSFRSEKAGAWAKFATADSGDWGRSVSRFEIEYLAQPGGGDLALVVDGKEAGVVATAADAPRLARHQVTVPDGPHALEVRSVDDRPVRAFGIRMERDEPGISLSALGITGARARFLDQIDDAHWAEALRAANPDLLVLAYGTNEACDGMQYPLADYERTLRDVMRQVRAALPGASLMLAAPPDLATTAEGTMHTRPLLPVLVKIQRKLAEEEGWAFWDQFMAMGGAGTMWQWIKIGMGSTDMFHPTGIGGNQLGTWQYRALVEAFEAYKARR